MFAQTLILAMMLSAPPAADADLAEQVRDTVRQLRADELKERDAAEKKLLEIGPAALDSLPAANDQMPEEMRQRLARIRLRLEQTRAEAAAGGTHITRKVDKQPLSEVLKKLEKLSGNRIVSRIPEMAPAGGGAPAEPTVSLDVKDVPFWQALDLVLDQVGLTVDITATDEGKPLRALAVNSPLVPQTSRAKRANYSGALRFEPITITSRRGLADAEAGGMQVVVEAAWEPRLAPITLSFPRDSLSVKLDDGRELKSAREGVESMTVRGSGVRFTVFTDLPPRAAHTIQKASGRLNVLVPGREETFRCGPLAAGFKSREKKGGVTVSVDRVVRNGDGWEIGLRLKFDNPSGALQSHLLDWVNDNETWLETPDGKKIESGSYESTREEEDEYGISYVFPVAGDIKGYTFVYRTPAALVEKSIPFELKNLELP